MKRAGLLFSFLFATSAVLLRADEPAAVPPAPVPVEPAKVSPEITQQITAALPKFNPAPPAEAKPANAPNPDVLELPKMTVKQKPRPRLTPAIVITTKGDADKQMSALDRSLNAATLPLFGQSYADRMRDEKERSKNEQMRKEALEMAKTAEVTDPALAKALRDAVK
jgi:hypothetical protein